MIKCEGWDHVIDVNDYGVYQCVRCRSFFTTIAIKKCLRFRFQDGWEMQWSILTGKKERLREKERKEERRLRKYDPLYGYDGNDPEDHPDFE